MSRCQYVAVGTSPSVIVVRHGETEWSRAGRHTSHTDLALTDVGRAQATAVGSRLAGYDFAEVWSSPMRRATETCALAGFGDRASTVADLCEWDYGEFEGLTTPEIREQAPGWTVFTADTPGGEDAFGVEQRVDRLVVRIRQAGGLVLCFGHGHSLRVLTARWLGLGAVDGHRFVLDPATVSILGYERGEPALLAWNT